MLNAFIASIIESTKTLNVVFFRSILRNTVYTIGSGDDDMLL